MSQIIGTENTVYHNDSPSGNYWSVDAHWKLETAMVVWHPAPGFDLDSYTGATRYTVPNNGSLENAVKSLELPVLKVK